MQVVGAACDQGRHLGQRAQARVLVVHLQRVQEFHQGRDRRAVHHLLGERHHARADLLVAVGRRPQDRADHRLGRAAGAVHGLRGVADREPSGLQGRVLEDLPERRPRNTFGGRGNQRRADDAGGIAPRVLPGVRQHGHAAHRMPDQHHRPLGRRHGEHGFQVLAQLLDGVGVRRGLRRLAVPALVVEHHPDLWAPLLLESCPLKVEGAHAQTESVREHHRQRRVLRTDLTHRQIHPVGRGHHGAAVGVEQLEILALVGIVARGAPGHRPRDGHSGDGAHRSQPRGTRQPAGVRFPPQPFRVVIAQRRCLSLGRLGTS